MIGSHCLDHRIIDPVKYRDEVVAEAEMDPSDLHLRR
jgi:hypothetical protein